MVSVSDGDADSENEDDSDANDFDWADEWRKGNILGGRTIRTEAGAEGKGKGKGKQAAPWNYSSKGAGKNEKGAGKAPANKFL